MKTNKNHQKTMPKSVFERISLICDKELSYCKGYSNKAAMEQLAKEYDGDQTYTAFSPMMYDFAKHHKVSYQHLLQVPLIYQCWNWDKGKVFYSFDEELEKEIKRSDLSLSAKIPASLLNHCPHTSFFVQTRDGMRIRELGENIINEGPDAIDDGMGFFVNISPNYKRDPKKQEFVETGENLLEIVWCSENEAGGLTTLDISMRIPQNESGATIEECFIPLNYEKAYADDLEKRAFSENLDRTALLHALQYVLLICAKNSIITRREQKFVHPWMSKKKKKVLGGIKIYDVTVPSERSFPANRPSCSSTGHGTTGRTIAPHVRRAHSAHRWVGSKENRHLELRWIHETYVHAESVAKGAVVKVR